MQSISNRQLFLSHIAQTSPAPLALEIVKAQGVKMWDLKGKEYIDLIAGISVCNVGHCHPSVIKAVQKQVEKYMHIMVYGELIQSPQVEYASLLVQHLPSSLNSVYFTNSGAEATEGAMKLAKRVTNRSKIIAFDKSYHGSTQGALSIIGNEYWRNAYRPLLPDVYHFNYNTDEVVEHIDEQTACVILEPIQAESGITKPDKEWLQAIRKKCTENGVLLVVDEIQAGFGRTGSLWAFEQFDIIPDILLLGKSLGGGMPLGCFIADTQLMQTLTHNPVLGHITTFGGHPVCCAAGKAAFDVLMTESCIKQVKEKEAELNNQLQHTAIINKRSAGLWMALQFENFEINKKIIDHCIEKGVFTDWFLFASDCLRISPPLNITTAELQEACAIIIQSIDEATR